MQAIKFTVVDGMDNEEEVKIPAKWAICNGCEGCGTDRGRSVEREGGGFTASEWDEEDEDFRRGYMRGDYDRPCEYCEGTGKVLVVDRDRAEPEILKQYDAWLQEEREYRAMVAAERRMGA